jgi:RNA polymerase sigma-70 factor (ECF subfamily)
MLNEVDRARLEDDVRALCEAGNNDAAATMALRAYGPEIFGFLRAIQSDEALASEAFSAFSEGLWRGLPGFEWSSTLRTWAYGIARIAARGARRDAARHDKRGMRVGVSALEEVAAAVRTQTLEFLRTDKRSRLQAMRDALDPEDRALLVLRIDRGLAWNDLARVLAEGSGALDEAAVQREAARLRKRYQHLKERLREAAKREGLRE